MRTSSSKTVAGRTYLHSSCFELFSGEAREQIEKAEKHAGIQRQQWNVARLDTREARIALLNYPLFFDEPFPALRESWLI